jgi:hypothetical protein
MRCAAIRAVCGNEIVFGAKKRSLLRSDFVFAARTSSKGVQQDDIQASTQNNAES